MPEKYTEAQRYVCWVLWVTGFSIPMIAKVLGLRNKQVAGLVTRSPYPNRSALTEEERQKSLDELLAVRIGDDGRPIDGGLLENPPRKIIPLQDRQVK